MKKIPLLALLGSLLYSCGHDNGTDNTDAVPMPVLVKDTEARDLKGNVRSFISVSWQTPSAAEMELSFDSLHAKVGRHIARYSGSNASFTVSEAEAKEAGRAHIQRDAFDTNGSLIFLAQYKKMWRPRRAIRSAATVAYFDTTLDGNIYYHDTTVLNPARSVNHIIDEFITVADSTHFVKTSLLRQNILRNDTIVVWAQTTTISGDVPDKTPPSTDTVAYKILAKDPNGNLLKVLVSHTDKQQPNELILYKYTYYE